MSDLVCIMVVDDEIINQEILAEYIEEAGMVPYRCTSAEAAWLVLKSTPERFKAILLDIMLPQVSGLELLSQLKADDDLKSIPVILQSSKANRVEVDRGLELGAFRYVTKPYTQEQILEAVNAALEV